MKLNVNVQERTSIVIVLIVISMISKQPHEIIHTQAHILELVTGQCGGGQRSFLLLQLRLCQNDSDRRAQQYNHL